MSFSSYENICSYAFCSYFRPSMELGSSSPLFCLPSCFFVCRIPNPETVLVVQTPSGVFSTRSLPQHQNREGSRLISDHKTELSEPSASDITEFDPFSAARCRIYKTSKNKVIFIQAPYMFQLLFIFDERLCCFWLDMWPSCLAC